MVECPHGGDPLCCPPCQQPPAPRRVARSRPTSPSQVIEAEYAGTCGECGFDIVVGDRITRVGRSTRGRTVRRVWVHAQCADVEVSA